MNIMHSHRKRELTILALSLAIAVLGVYLAWACDSAWLNRAGSLIIVVGVLSATSRLQEAEKRVREYINQNIDPMTDEIIEKFESENRALSENDKKEIKNKTREAIFKDLAEIFAEHMRRMKAWELRLVVVGTLINGFGNWLIDQAKCFLA